MAGRAAWTGEGIVDGRRWWKYCCEGPARRQSPSQRPGSRDSRARLSRDLRPFVSGRDQRASGGHGLPCFLLRRCHLVWPHSQTEAQGEATVVRVTLLLPRTSSVPTTLGPSNAEGHPSPLPARGHTRAPRGSRGRAAGWSGKEALRRACRPTSGSDPPCTGALSLDANLQAGVGGSHPWFHEQVPKHFLFEGL